MNDLLSRATNPYQYDDVGTDWLAENVVDAPWRSLFKEILGPALGNLYNKRVLDIGCGTGWLSQFVAEMGAKTYLGIEPCVLSYKTALESYPTARFINITFEEYNTDEKFDLIISLMSSEHIKDLSRAFKSWGQLLSKDGKIVIIAADLGFFSTPRFNYNVIIEKLSENEAVVWTIRPRSVDTIDIVRRPSVYLRAAAQAGFKGSIITPILPSDSLIKFLPKYQKFQNQPIYQLLTFVKNWGDR